LSKITVQLNKSHRTSNWGLNRIVKVKAVELEETEDTVRLTFLSQKTKAKNTYVEFSHSDWDALLSAFIDIMGDEEEVA
jgi:hypothetical protein